MSKLLQNEANIIVSKMLNPRRDTMFISYLPWFTGEDALGFRTDYVETSGKDRKCFSELLYNDISIK